MVLIHSTEYLLINFLHHEMVLADDPVGRDQLNDSAADKLRQRKARCLIVDNAPFHLAALDCRELAPNGTVAYRDLRRGQRHVASSQDNLHADGHHDRVEDAGVPFLLELTLACHLAQAHHHVGARDSDLVEGSPAVVLASVANLGAQVATFNARTDLPCLNTPDLHHERLNSIVIAIDETAGKDHSVASKHA